MKATPTEIVLALLVDRGLAARPNTEAAVVWPGYKGWSPSEPDDTICLYSADPTVDAKEMRGGVTLMKPRVMIRVRSITPDTAEIRINEIANELSIVKRKLLVCQIEDGSDTEQILLKSADIVDGPHGWRHQEEEKRRATFTMTVQINPSEVV